MSPLRRTSACLGWWQMKPDYKLCWTINQALGLAFEKLDDLILFHRKLKEEQVFSQLRLPG